VLVRKMNEEPQVTQQALDALLVARNLERVADHATNISEDVIFWVSEPMSAITPKPASPRAPSAANSRDRWLSVARAPSPACCGDFPLDLPSYNRS
jgi:hypothetical protein